MADGGRHVEGKNHVKAMTDDSRKIYTDDVLGKKYGIPEEEVDLKTRISEVVKKNLTCSYERCAGLFVSFIPILGWLPQYKIKDCLLGDLIAGFTIAVVQLPQAMAYAMLASLPAVHGLYASFIPVLTYALLGTVRHVSIGTFAVVCIMVGEVVDEHAPEPSCTPSTTASITSTTASDMATTSSATDECEAEYLRDRIAVAVALCMAVGLIQLIMFLLRLGIITVYLSEPLVSGFTCGAGFHVLTSQISKLIGISVPKYSGPLALVYTYIDIFSHLYQINWATVIVSVICIVFLVIGKEINARYHDKIPVPIPWEFAVVLFSTLGSHYGLLNEKYDVSIVGDIPTGLRLSTPKGPDIGAVMVEAIPIAVVIYAIEVSLGKMFALKHSYQIDSNQELFALGTSNVVSSFFSSIPCAASLSRSVIWDEVGGKTQITGIVSSGLILVILLWIGPLFESLPQAALASIIVVSLKRILKQFERIPPYWRICKLDAVTWIVTWLSVFLLGVDVGLLVGLGFEIATVVFNTQVSNGAVLGEVNGSGSYKNVKRYETNQDLDKNVVVYAYNGPLYFANHERFRAQLSDAIGFDPLREATTLKTMRSKQEKKAKKNSKAKKETKTDERGVENGGFVEEKTEAESGKKLDIDIGASDEPTSSVEESNGTKTRSIGSSESISSVGDAVIYAFGVTAVILDMSSCSFLDNDGAKTMKAVFSSLRVLDISLLLVSCTDDARRTLEKVCQDDHPPFFLTLDGAMQFAKGEIVLNFDKNGNIEDEEPAVQQTSL